MGADVGSNVYVKSDTSPFVVQVAKADLEALEGASMQSFLLDGDPAPEPVVLPAPDSIGELEEVE